MQQSKVILKKDRDYAFIEKHPWVFSGSILKTEGSLKDGDQVGVYSFDNKFIAWGLYNSKSQITVRLYSWEENVEINDRFFEDKIRSAVFFRKKMLSTFDDQSATRLIFSEGDGISGLTVDKYGSFLVIQITSLAIALRIGIITKILIELCNPEGIYLRTEKGILEEEGLGLEDSLIWGNEITGELIIIENSLKYIVDPRAGQKTGFYIDQRDNRSAIRKFVKNKKVLDVCCYSGGFSLNAIIGGAEEVTGVDVSDAACNLYNINMTLNNLTNFNIFKSDAFKFLEKTAQENIKYDVIILDPPKFSHSKSSLKTALKGYFELNNLALNCLNENGILVTCSCSGRVSKEDFISVLHKSSIHSKRDLQIIEIHGQASDHPISINCPESEYLKCIFCRSIQ
jgi:23S rRNA (cytosine1962-C5)-methyltransferase